MPISGQSCSIQLYKYVSYMCMCQCKRKPLGPFAQFYKMKSAQRLLMDTSICRNPELSEDSSGVWQGAQA